jgi:Mg-chelatase subunit ChlD
VWKATTYGDGRVPFYPRLFGSAQPPSRYEVSATVGAEALTAAWDGKDELTLAAAGPRAGAPLRLEVLFLIDTTGSMGDEIDRIKTTLVAVTDKVRGTRADLDLRYGAVLYKDVNDEYVTMAHPFTADIAAFSQALQAITAGGGGDLPESLNQGLSRAVEGMPWTPDAAKVMFLVCDAPPQMRLKGDVLYGDSAVRAVARGIRVHGVAASGLDPLGTLVLRQVAQLTRGKFIFIEYGGTQATAASHGVSGPVDGGNNLDAILLAQITAEIEGWGR